MSTASTVFEEISSSSPNGAVAEEADNKIEHHPEQLGTLRTMDLLLRDLPSLLKRIEKGEHLAELARSFILTIVFSTVIFGIGLGACHGGIQILYSALKFPVIVLATAVICTPALSALNSAVGRPVSYQKDLALMLASVAAGSLAIAALTPVLLLARLNDLEYLSYVSLAIGCCLVGGGLGISVLIRGAWRAGKQGLFWVLGGLLSISLLVSSQLIWTSRPYLLRPGVEEVPFVRSIEGSFLDAVTGSLRAQVYSNEADVDVFQGDDTNEYPASGWRGQ